MKKAHAFFMCKNGNNAGKGAAGIQNSASLTFPNFVTENKGTNSKTPIQKPQGKSVRN